jgi:hypothetical protein
VLGFNPMCECCSRDSESFCNIISRGTFKGAVRASRPSSSCHINCSQFVFTRVGAPTVDLCLIVCISMSYNIEVADAEIVLICMEHLGNCLIVWTTYNPTASSILEPYAFFKSLRARTRSIRSYMKLRMNSCSNCSLVEGGGGGP